MLNATCSVQAAQQLEAAGRLLEAYEAVTGRLLPDTPLMHFVQLYLEASKPKPINELAVIRCRHACMGHWAGALGGSALLAEPA